MAVPSARSSGASVENVSALSGTNTSPRPKPWMMPGQTISDTDSTTVYCIICHSAKAEIRKPANSSTRASIRLSSRPASSMESMVPAPLGAVTSPVVATG